MHLLCYTSRRPVQPAVLTCAAVPNLNWTWLSTTLTGHAVRRRSRSRQPGKWHTACLVDTPEFFSWNTTCLSGHVCRYGTDRCYSCLHIWLRIMLHTTTRPACTCMQAEVLRKLYRSEGPGGGRSRQPLSAAGVVARYLRRVSGRRFIDKPQKFRATTSHVRRAPKQPIQKRNVITKPRDHRPTNTPSLALSPPSAHTSAGPAPWSLLPS